MISTDIDDKIISEISNAEINKDKMNDILSALEESLKEKPSE